MRILPGVDPLLTSLHRKRINDSTPPAIHRLEDRTVKEVGCGLGGLIQRWRVVVGCTQEREAPLRYLHQPNCCLIHLQTIKSSLHSWHYHGSYITSLETWVEKVLFLPQSSGSGLAIYWSTGLAWHLTGIPCMQCITYR